jgi:hypothetical protein
MYIYLDDILFVGPDEDTVNRSKNYVHKELRKCGFLINEEKSIPAAVECDWLGFTIRAGKLFLPRSTCRRVNAQWGKIKHLHSLGREAKQEDCLTAKLMLEFVGLLQWVARIRPGIRSRVNRAMAIVPHKVRIDPSLHGTRVFLDSDDVRYLDDVTAEMELLDDPGYAPTTYKDTYEIFTDASKSTLKGMLGFSNLK